MGNSINLAETASSGIVIIAKGLSIDTNVEQVNTLTWEGSNDGTNTAPVSIVIVNTGGGFTAPISATLKKNGEHIGIMGISGGFFSQGIQIKQALSQVSGNTFQGPVVNVTIGTSAFSRAGNYALEIVTASGATSLFDIYILGIKL